MKHGNKMISPFQLHEILIKKFTNQPITDDLINQINNEVNNYLTQNIDEKVSPQYSIEIIDNQITIWPLDIYSALLLEGNFKYSYYYINLNTQKLAEGYYKFNCNEGTYIMSLYKNDKVPNISFYPKVPQHFIHFTTKIGE